MPQSLPTPIWPNGARGVVALTFDVDGEAGWPTKDVNRLTPKSEARFGTTRGVPNVLSLLREFDIRATCFIPGFTADSYPDVVRAIVADGHELGHHGYDHIRPDTSTEAEQRLEIEKGIDALQRIGGVTPRGYRSPWWELTPETVEILCEHGLIYDSSCMGDDRPYIEEGRNGSSLIEVPVQWTTSDWPYFGYVQFEGGQIGDPAVLASVWKREFELAYADGRMLAFTMHPEVIGRSGRLDALRQVIEYMRTFDDVWFATCGEIADVAAATPAQT